MQLPKQFDNFCRGGFALQSTWLTCPRLKLLMPAQMLAKQWQFCKHTWRPNLLGSNVLASAIQMGVVSVVSCHLCDFYAPLPAKETYFSFLGWYASGMLAHVHARVIQFISASARSKKDRTWYQMSWYLGPHSVWMYISTAPTDRSHVHTVLCLAVNRALRPVQLVLSQH